MRSLIEPPGFWLSSLTNSSHGPVSNELEPDERRVADQRQDVARRRAGRIGAPLTRACGAQAVLEVGPQVLHVLEPDRQPDQRVGDAERLAHRRAGSRRAS